MVVRYISQRAVTMVKPADNVCKGPYCRRKVSVRPLVCLSVFCSVDVSLSYGYSKSKYTVKRIIVLGGALCNISDLVSVTPDVTRKQGCKHKINAK